jgi:hypothetical protein
MQFDDLLVIDGISEHYHNITHKTRAWLTWINKNCSGSEIILKIDDDVQINMEGLVNLFNLFNKHSSLILCRLLRSGQVVRNPNSKWFLSKNEYKSSSLGNYCQGAAYIISSNLIPKMVDNIKRVQYLWVRLVIPIKISNFQMDDWYVTRALMNSTKAIYVDIGNHYANINNRSELATFFDRNLTKFHSIIFEHFRK